VEIDHPFQKYFPSPIYAIAIPAGLLVCALVFVGLFVSIVILKEIQNTKKKS
jgi:hypothetical protein